MCDRHHKVCVWWWGALGEARSYRDRCLPLPASPPSDPPPISPPPPHLPPLAQVRYYNDVDTTGVINPVDRIALGANFMQWCVRRRSRIWAGKGGSTGQGGAGKGGVTEVFTDMPHQAALDPHSSSPSCTDSHPDRLSLSRPFLCP